jgi:hypothetical protein
VCEGLASCDIMAIRNCMKTNDLVKENRLNVLLHEHPSFIYIFCVT